VKLRYHPEARAELRAAMRISEEERPGRGIALQELVRRIERRVLKVPRSAPRWLRLPTPFEVRKAVVHRTPYFVVYIILPDQIVIVAIAHSRKEPGYWRDRLGEIG
jgi:toxin ParE1/3/4